MNLRQIYQTLIQVKQQGKKKDRYTKIFFGQFCEGKRYLVGSIFLVIFTFLFGQIMIERLGVIRGFFFFFSNSSSRYTGEDPQH
jgi:hypothetical protein